MMPVMDGFEFLLHVSNDEAYRDLPIVIVTPNDLKQAEANTLRQHADAIIQKGDFKKDELLNHISRILQKKQSKKGGENG